jgi:hypothetical protein
MGLTFKTTSLKTSGSVGWATSRGIGPKRVDVITLEAELPGRLVRSLASRGAGEGSEERE